MNPKTNSNSERGSASLELAMLSVTILTFFLLLIVGARVSMAHQSLQSAAFAGARDASLVRTVGEASSAGSAGANLALNQAGIKCTNTSIGIDTSAFSKPIGTVGQVRATLTCKVKLADVAFPGLPGNITITKHSTSPIDPYRER